MYFLQLRFDISSLFRRYNNSIEWYFFSAMCLCGNFEALYSLHFFHLNRFKYQFWPPNVFWRKFNIFFQHLNITILQSISDQMTPNLIHILYNTYTTRLYVSNFYTWVTFRSIPLQKQWMMLLKLKRPWVFRLS